MNYTPEQCRKAFYQAADYIEANPEQYDFNLISVGEEGCPACMWGHAGRALGVDKYALITDILQAFGFARTYDSEMSLYAFRRFDFDYHESATDAAAKMRAFADHHWPEGKASPETVSWGDMMQALKGEVA